jgi:hypothetical protein
MNSIVEEELPAIQGERDLLLAMVTDQDLAYKLPGSNPTLGELFVEMGTTQQAYTRSFTTLTMNWNDRDGEPKAPLSVASLRAWYATLDTQLHAALSVFGEDELQSTHIDRGHGFTPTVFVQYQIFREAHMIFCAKASVYLKALEKPFTEQMKGWIG